MPFSVPHGPYFLGATVDPLDAIDEISESNNTATGDLFFVGPRADLTVAIAQAPSAPVLPGKKFTVEATVCNKGSITAWTTKAEVRLAGLRLGMVHIGPVTPGLCVPVSILASGAFTPASSLSVAVTTTSNEVSTANNVAVGEPYAIGRGPDLVTTVSSTVSQGALITTTRCATRARTTALSTLFGSVFLPMKFSMEAIN